MIRPRLLDLFCGAGGAAMGYYRAGYDIVGIDINHQSNYPFPFIQGDAIDILRRMLAGEKFLANDGQWYGIEDFAAIHASPPCQKYTTMQNLHNSCRVNHPDLIEPTRELLNRTDKPYVIENVIGAPLRVDLMLCGTMFGIKIPRHRIFESNIAMPILTMVCRHENLYDPYHGGDDSRNERGKMLKVMDIPYFMTRPEVRNAIPPAYTEFIGRQLLRVLEAQ